MLQSEFSTQLARVDMSSLESQDLFEIAQAIYVAEGIVPGGYKGHAAVAGMIAANPEMFSVLSAQLAAMRLRAETAEAANGVLESSAMSRIAMLEAQQDALLKQYTASVAQVSTLRDEVNSLHRRANQAEYALVVAEQQIKNQESVESVYDDLYGEPMMKIAREAAQTRRNNA